ncbi:MULTISPECIES: TonB-dependent receptor [Acidobacteriaceae]|uniref:TonB-dependent receptor n=1 Tax=Acidobacteriaceae TaxID=204434 RepID=UPI00131B8DE1|nr:MULTISPECIES: TonB-dependent receptor [Acidobacteriaceae]MDW5267716.1 carboxypeptidase regulatory-like domain-containing protein [Edaphobacter sp.]
MHKSIVKYLSIWALSFVICSLAFAQSTTSNLTGIVTDQSGAVIVGAQVNVENVDVGKHSRLETNAEGRYNAAALQPGRYTVKVEKPGYSPRELTGITIAVNQSATLNVQLDLGSTSQTVTVTGEAQLINVTTAELAQQVTESSIKELPLNGRDPSTLVLLAPGVTNVLNTSAGTLQTTDAFANETGASANGGRQGSTYYLLDGAPNMDRYDLLAAPFPNADATQEFNVTTNNFDAQYGFSPGAVVSIQTKSGTNAIHGQAFEFLRNNALNAAQYFSHQVDPLKRNQFGGSIGGPILKNKLFLFANYQGTRASSAATSNVAFTPTAAMVNGDFSALLQGSNPVQLTNPATGLPYPNNQIDPTTFSPGAVKFLSVLPVGQEPLGQVIYTGAALTTHFDEGTARLDYSLSDKHHFVLRTFFDYYNQPGSSANGNFIASQAGNLDKYQNHAFNYIWTPTPAISNVFVASYTSLNTINGTSQLDAQGNPICLSHYINVSEPAGRCAIEGLSVSGGFGSGYQDENTQARTTWTASDSLSKQAGKHFMTAGGDMFHQFWNLYSAYPTEAIIGFNGSATGYGLADYLLGRVATFYQGGGETQKMNQWELALFVQDQYHISRSLTVTAGVRWEPFLPPPLVNGRGAAFRPGQQSQRFPNAPLGLVFPGDRGISNSLVPSAYDYFVPRIGLAWQPASLPHTSVRAAFGIFTTPIQYSSYNHTSDLTPFSTTYSFNSTPGNPISFDDPYANYAPTGGKNPFPPFADPNSVAPADTVFPAGLNVPTVFSSNFRLGETQSWNLSMQQSFAHNLALQLAYVGSESFHQQTPVDRNPGIYSAGGARSTYPAFAGILENNVGGTASYHSLQVTVEKNLSNNFQFRSNFTWSKAIDIASSGTLAFTGGVGNPFNLRSNRGISDVNIPLVSVTSLIYTTPKLQKRGVLLRSILGGWQVSGIYTAQSGTPFSIAGGDGSNNSGAQQYGDRADLTGLPFGVRSGGKQNWLNHYFNANAFRVNAPGTFGTSGRNLFQGPPLNNADLGFSKNWYLQERYRLQFRWELFNAFNHASFGTPNNDPSSPNVGQITSTASAARVMQGAVKLYF